MVVSHAYVGMCVVSAVVAAGVGIGAWGRRRTAPVGPALAVVAFGLAVGAGFIAAQVAVPAMTRVFGFASLMAICVVVAGWYCEVRILTDPCWRVRPVTLAWLGVHPLVVAVLGGLNPGHLFAVGAVVGGAPQVASPPGPLFWMHLGYCYTVGGWCFQHLARAMVRGSSPLQRRQLRAVLLSAGLPTAASVMALVHSRSGPDGLDLTPLALSLMGVVHYYAVFRLGLLRLLPVARNLVVEHVGDAIVVVDSSERVVDVNPAARRLVARLTGAEPPSNLHGLPVWSLLPHRQYRRLVDDGEHHLDTPSGPMDLDLRIDQILDRHGHLQGRVIVARDVTELHHQRRQLAVANQELTQQLRTIDGLRGELAEQANRDELTGLRNRRYLTHRLDDDLDHARVTAKPLSAVLFDLDHFKQVNDRHGHRVGDELLTTIASTLLAGLRPGDTLARYGGEEFVVILPDTAPAEALHVAEALRARCATTRICCQNGQVSVTLSAGVATFPDAGWTGPQLLDHADKALYAAKHNGRDQVAHTTTP